MSRITKITTLSRMLERNFFNQNNVNENFAIHNLTPATKKYFTTNSSNRNEKLTKITIEPKTKIATLTMNRLPANALSFELMTEMKNALHDLERQKVNGIILTSSSDRIFCAGLDLNQVYKPDLKRLSEFWTAFQNLWQALFATPLPTVALINGHAMAGGCLISTACDYRVMLPKFTIGMNETRAGIAAPKFVMGSYTNVVHSRRIAEADFIEGRCYKSDGALEVGLVDAVIETRYQAFEKCLEFLRTYEGPTRMAKAQTKLSFREEILKEFEKNRQKDLDSFVKGILRAEVQEFIGNYLKSLKEKAVNNKV